MAVALSPVAGAGWQFFDNSGAVLTGGLLYTYTAGTTTPVTTYQDSAGSTPNANPVVLDASGRVSAEVWLTTGAAYKLVLKTSTGTTLWTMDNLRAINDPASVAWAVITGNTLSALVGISVIHFVDDPLMAMSFAASLSIFGMFILRCLHPPAAAIALIVVLGNVMHYRYAFFPIMIDSVVLVLVGAVYSNLTGKSYPNRPN